MLVAELVAPRGALELAKRGNTACVVTAGAVGVMWGKFRGVVVGGTGASSH